jgi:uncharacterized protein (UPF0548 family)
VEQLEDRVVPSGPGDLLWARQFGSQVDDIAMGVSANGSGAYVAGYTSGALPGQSNAGGIDAFVAKFDASGTLLWSRQFGSADSDHALAVSSDATGVYVAGFTDGALPGQTSAGGIDAFLVKYDADGNLLWTRQFGTSATDHGYGVSADGSGVYVTGSTDDTLPGQSSVGGTDAFVARYDAAGNLVWARQFGSTSAEVGWGASADGSGVYISGGTAGALPGQSPGAGDQDAFVARYDAAGNLLWARQFGSLGFAQSFGVSGDGSGVYVSGYTIGSLPGQTDAGGSDAFVVKYDADGNLLWIRQFGTPVRDYATGVSANGSGAYVAGYTEGTLPGQTNAGLFDAFVVSYDADGNPLWIHQFGSTNEDPGRGVSADRSGVYVAGGTNGNLPGQGSNGGNDAFVAKFLTSTGPVLAPIPDQTVNEGSTLTLTASATDPDAGQALSYSLDPGAPAGARIDPASGVFTFTPSDGPASYTVTVRVTDSESPARSDTQSFHILVKNVAPTARVLGPAVGFAGQGLIFTLRVGDAPADAAAGFRYVVRWGDGTPAQIIAATPGNGAGLLVSHVYSVRGVRNVRITATDKDGSTSLVATTSVTILTPPPGNVLPHLGAWTRNLGSTGIVQLSGSIEDRGSGGPFTLGVNWGDGKTSTFRVPGSGTSLTIFSRAHHYAAQGTYTIGLVVVDSRGGKDGRTIVVLVGKDDGCEDNDTLAQACPVVGGAPVTGLILLDSDWYRFTTVGQGGISQYVFEVTITGGQGTVNLELFTPRGSFWKATSSGGGHRAAVSWATSAIKVPYYFRVTGTPGLTYSVEVIDLPS